MKIGIDGRMYGAQSTTGIGVYIERLTQAIFDLDQENEYYIFLKPEIFGQFKSPQQRIHKIPLALPWYSWAEQWQLPRILKKYQLDLVHFPHFNVPIRYSGKYLVTIHDITPKFFPGPLARHSLIRRLGYNLVFQTALKKSAKIIAISQQTKDNLSQYFGADSNKIEVIYLGVDPPVKIFTAPGALVELKNKYQITKPFLFYVGVWRDHKNLPGLVAAFDLIKSQYHLDYQLVLAGQNDPRYPEIQAAINHSQFKNDIITPGFVSQPDLAGLYQAAALFVLPSFTEGFGLVALEALSYQTPVVASKTTSLPEIIAEAGLYFDPYQPADMARAISQILSDKNLKQKLVSAGQTKIKAYNWQKTAQQTLSLYRSLFSCLVNSQD